MRQPHGCDRGGVRRSCTVCKGHRGVGDQCLSGRREGSQDLPITESWGKTTVTLEPVGVAGLITPWNANVLFICLELRELISLGLMTTVQPAATAEAEDEAIRIANDSKYGLHAAVLGTELQRARRVASQIRAGRVVINGMADDPQAPWGGSNTQQSAVNTDDTGSRPSSKPVPSFSPKEDSS